MQRTLELLHEEDVIRRLGLEIPLAGAVPQPPGVPGAAGYDSEQKAGLARLEQLFSYLVELCSARCWSQIQFAMLCPQFLAIVHHDSLQVRGQGLNRARQIWDAVLAAEQIVFETPKSPTVSKATRVLVTQCLTDCAWNVLQVARESCSVCRKAKWSYQDRELRLLTERLFARPSTTKFFLEDCFNHCGDVARRHAKGMVMQRPLGICHKLAPESTLRVF